MQDVRAGASRKNFGRNFLMLNLFNATERNDKEKSLRMARADS